MPLFRRVTLFPNYRQVSEAIGWHGGYGIRYPHWVCSQGDGVPGVISQPGEGKMTGVSGDASNGRRWVTRQAGVIDRPGGGGRKGYIYLPIERDRRVADPPSQSHSIYRETGQAFEASLGWNSIDEPSNIWPDRWPWCFLAPPTWNPV